MSGCRSRSGRLLDSVDTTSCVNNLPRDIVSLTHDHLIASPKTVKNSKQKYEMTLVVTSEYFLNVTSAYIRPFSIYDEWKILRKSEAIIPAI